MILTVVAASCGGGESVDHQAEWRDVLEHKRAAAAPDASPDHKQVYADSVRAFVQKHPGHGRAREVWERIQLEFANDLAAAGRYQDSIRFYRAILVHDPDHDEARRGLAVAASRLAVSHDDLAALQKGMTHRHVSAILGKPMPGWSVKTRRAGTTFEAWYYRTRRGDVAGVYFRDGKVIAAEEASNAKIGRLGS